MFNFHFYHFVAFYILIAIYNGYLNINHANNKNNE